jgi:hypothetical protein
MDTRAKINRQRETKRLLKRKQREDANFLAFEAIEAKRRRIDHKLEDAARDLLLIKREQEIAKLKAENLQLKIQLNY